MKKHIKGNPFNRIICWWKLNHIFRETTKQEVEEYRDFNWNDLGTKWWDTPKWICGRCGYIIYKKEL